MSTTIASSDVKSAIEPNPVAVSARWRNRAIGAAIDEQHEHDPEQRPARPR